MASIFKRKLKDGKSFTWRAVVRVQGHPPICNTFQRKQEAEDWGQEVERQIKMGKFKFERRDNKRTYKELVDRYVSDGALEHLRSVDDVIRHLNYWKERLGSYALVHLTPERLSKRKTASH